MIFYLEVVAIPLLLCAVAWLWLQKYHLEYGILAGVIALVSGVTVTCILIFGPEALSLDTEIWNGRIVDRHRERVSCSHSYKCHCHDVCSGSGKDKSCHEECDTCYEHSYDIDWIAKSSNDETFTFDRVDRQGLLMPDRYKQVFIGEPTAVEHHFENYFKLAIHNVVANFSDV
jgi:hypothetical protein